MNVLAADECLFLAKPELEGRVPVAMGRLLCRVILKRSKCEGSAFNGRTLDSLVSHSDDIRNDPAKSDFFVTLSHVLYDYMGAVNLPSVSDLFELFGKVLVNAFTIFNDDLNTIGMGLYIGLSELNHSCLPEAFVLFDGVKATLRALKEGISQYDSKLRISYCDILELTATRRDTLRQQFFFICDCALCNDQEREHDASSVICVQCDTGYCPLDPKRESLICWNCGVISKVSVDAAVQLMQHIEWVVLRLADGKSDSIEHAKSLLNEAELVLSPLNILKCQLADRIATWAVNNSDFKLAAELVEKTILCYKRFYMPGHPALSLQYFKAGKLHSLSDLSLELAAKRLEQAVDALHRSHGVQHHLSVQARELLSKVRQQRRDLKNKH